MPNPKVCNRIADPAARRRCLEYQGEFAQPAQGSRPGMGGPRRRPTRGGRGFGGGGFGGRGGY